MADLLEAMGFPSDWCEHALRTCGGLEAAIDLLLQWQAHGAPNPLSSTIQASPPTLRLSLGSDQPLSSTQPAISTSAKASAIADSSDAVVPDAFAELRRQRAAAAAKAKKEKESEKERIRRQLQEDMEMRQYRQNLGKTAETSACGAENSAARHSNKSSSSADLQIRCPGFETIKASFAAGSTLKEVRAYVERALKKPRCATRSAAPLRTRTPFSGKSAKLSDSDGDRELLNAAREQFEIQTSRIIAEAQALRQAQTPDSSEHKSNKAIYFLIPLPRQEFFTEASLETTLAEAQLVPRGTLTVHFKECLEGRPAESHVESPSDVVATISQDAYQFQPATTLSGDRRDCREDSTLEVEGLRERALQAAAKRMSEAAEFFREGLPPDGSEVAVSFRCPVDYTSNDSVCTDEVATAPRVSDYASAMQSGNESGPRDAMRSHIMHAVEARLHCQDQQTSCMEALQKVQDLPKSRVRIPASSRLLCRPEKLQRVEPHEATNREEVADTGASDARDVDKGKGLLCEHNFQEAGPSSTNTVDFETPIPQSSLRVRLEDGSVHLHIFRADSTTLKSVLQSLIPEGTDAALYGLVLPFPEPHFVEGEALMITLEDAGLVPRGTVHLSRVSSRGVIRQGRRTRRSSRNRSRRSRSFDIDDVEDHWEGYDSAQEMSYEEILELEESIGRVHVGVPESAINTFPTRIVQMKARQNDEDEQPEVCVVCMGEYVAGEEAMSLPCFHSFHSGCIRKWLSQSTSCPTCKQSVA